MELAIGCGQYQLLPVVIVFYDAVAWTELAIGCGQYQLLPVVIVFYDEWPVQNWPLDVDNTSYYLL
jgi:hypothetical protein